MKPFFVLLGGTVSESSSSERALSIVEARLGTLGAAVQHFSARHLDLPMYRPGSTEDNPLALNFVNALRRASGVIVSSPCYHGSLSGLVKNALDYAEELSRDDRTYLSGRAFGAIGCGAGASGPVTVAHQIRQIGHALRAWNLPSAVIINTKEVKIGAPDERGETVTRQLHRLADQAFAFATGAAHVS